jgi:TPR repeat protein
VIGAHFELVACLGAAPERCDEAAARIGDLGWSHFLRGAPVDGLEPEAASVWNHLSCADGRGAACAALAGQRLAREVPDRLRAATLHLRACALGEASSCDLLDLTRPADLDAAWLRLSDGADWSTPKPPAAGIPPAADGPELRIAARACDNRAEDLSACLDFAADYWRTLAAPTDRRASEDALDRLCPVGIEGSACALNADLRADDVLEADLQPTRALLDRLCTEDGSARACVLLGGLLELGRASPYGTPASRRALQRGCDAGDAAACARLTHAYRTPLAVSSEARCQRAIGGGQDDPRTCTETATMLQFGVGLDKDVERAEQLRRQACEAGDAAPCAWFANAAWTAGSALEAHTWYDKACVAGDGAACGVVGRMAMSGDQGIAYNASVGIPRLKRGCELGGRNACYEFGYNHSQGRGVPDDPHAAWRRYLQACGMGHLRACGSLGVLLLEGRGTVQNVAHAVAVLTYACERGDGPACRNLSQTWATGNGVEVNAARARWAAERGCALAHAGSCQDLEALPPGPSEPVPAAPLPDLVPLPVTTDILSGANVAQAGVSTPTASPSRYELPTLARRMAISVALGSQRSWTAANQATSLRLGYAYLFPWVGVAGTLDWVSDDRVRPRQARSYWRFDLWVDGFVHVDLGRYLELWAGLGAGIGGYRPEAGRNRDVSLAGGAHEYVQLDLRLGRVRVGVRVEQQQLGQDPTVLRLDHVTGFYGVLGFGGG